MSVFRITIDLVDTAGYIDPHAAVQEYLDELFQADVSGHVNFHILDTNVQQAKLVFPDDTI